MGRHFLEPLLKATSAAPQLYIEGRAVPVATNVEVAFDAASRKKGLLGRDGLEEGVALVIAPCSGVHTFFMRFPIDVVFARRDGSVIKVRHDMAMSRLSLALGAFAVIEMKAGSARRTNIGVGDRLLVR